MTITNNNNNNKDQVVLVTGANGFLGTYVLIKLLKEGYKVRATVRSLSKKDEVLVSIRNGGLAVGDNDIEFYQADLSLDDGWNEIVKGCKYVMHVASPVPELFNKPQEDSELQVIKPAVDGTLRVLRAARDNGVKRVVLTSSNTAISYGKGSENLNRKFTEEDWTDPNDDTLTPYVKSKVFAERAAWDFIEKECIEDGGSKSKLELAVINPTVVLGPILNSNSTASINIIKNIINGMASYPLLSFGVVDVRDVAEIHYLAMIKDEAKSQRFLTVSDDQYSTLPSIANIIKERMPEVSQNITTPPANSTDIKLKSGSNEKAKRLLNWKPRSSTESILSSVQSLKDFNVI